MTPGQSALRDRYRGQRIFLTGASGLVGQAVLEKILRALPDVGEVLLFLRPHGRTTAEDRLPEILRSPLFDRLRRERPDFDAWWPTKVSAVAGGLGLPRLGLTREDWTELASRVTAIIHAGALAAFDEPIDRVLDVNTCGSLDVLELARDAGNVPLVHVSTCYVCGNAPGTHGETVMPWGHTPRTLADGTDPVFDPEAELGALLERCERIRLDVTAGLPADERLRRLGVRVADRHGWPNPYPMSKAWAEQLLVRRRGSVPLSIVRPAIVESTLSEPEPGWLTGLRMTDPLIVAMGRALLDVFPGDRDKVIDLVPCDLVVNAILAALPERGPDAGPRVYQVAGSAKTPLTLGRFHDLCRTALVAEPFRDPEGVPIIPGHMELVDPPRFLRTVSRRRRALTREAAAAARSGREAKRRAARTSGRFLRYALRLGRTYAPYTVSALRFTTDNLDRLERSLSDADRALFPMDVARVDWRHYVQHVHVPAVRREAGEGGAAAAAAAPAQEVRRAQGAGPA